MICYTMAVILLIGGLVRVFGRGILGKLLPEYVVGSRN